MSGRLPSASALKIAATCPGSFAYPAVKSSTQWSDAGSAKHAVLADALTNGVEVALARAPGEVRGTIEEFLASGPFEFLRTLSGDEVAAVLFAEVAFAYAYKADTARVVGHNIGRDYGELRDEIAGSADVVAVGVNAVVVADWKTGSRAVDPAETNHQIRALCLAAARAYGKRTAIGVVYYVKDDGSGWYDTAFFDEFTLDEIALEVRQTVERVLSAQRAVAGGRQPTLTTGEHCRYCAAFTACPAQTALIRATAAAPDVVESWAAELTPATAATAWQRVQQLDNLVRRVKANLYAYASREPIDLGNGRVLGPVTSTRRAINGNVAWVAIEEQFGAEVADRAVQMEATQAGIERAIRDAAKAAGVPLARAKREIMTAIEKAGGVEVNEVTTVKEHAAGEEDAA